MPAYVKILYIHNSNRSNSPYLEGDIIEVKQKDAETTPLINTLTAFKLDSQDHVIYFDSVRLGTINMIGDSHIESARIFTELYSILQAGGTLHTAIKENYPRIQALATYCNKDGTLTSPVLQKLLDDGGYDYVCQSSK